MDRLPRIESIARHHAKRQDANVVCGSCSACCESGQRPFLETAEKQRFQHDEEGRLANKADGSCVYLVDHKCSVYKDRPKACRLFDCRPIAVAINAVDERMVEKSQFLDAVRERWEYSPPRNRQERANLNTYLALFFRKAGEDTLANRAEYACVSLVRMMKEGKLLSGEKQLKFDPETGNSRFE